MKRCRLSGAPFADVAAGDNCFPSRRPQLCSPDLLPLSPPSDAPPRSQPSPSSSAESLIPGNGLKIDVFLPPPLHQPLPTASTPNSLAPHMPLLLCFAADLDNLAWDDATYQIMSPENTWPVTLLNLQFTAICENLQDNGSAHMCTNFVAVAV